MSSPASSNKRKRGGANSSDRVKFTEAEMHESSPHSASTGDTAETSPAANTRHRKQTSQDQSAGLPPSKRARTRSNASGVNAAVTEGNKAADQSPSATSATEEAGDQVGNSVRRRSRATSGQSKRSSNGNRKHKVDDEDGREEEVEEEEGQEDEEDRVLDDTEKQMAEPGKAGLRDPIGGYKTNPPPTGRPVRVYADGVFDLFHLGHMRQLQQAKSAFPDTYLIVGVTGDAETHRRKGLTVLTGQERAETVRHCKWVDEVLPNCPWIVTAEFLAEHNIDYVAHDDEPYGASEGDDIYAPIKKQGKFLVTERTEGLSTTGIITKIVKDYEKYITRQLKRGTSRQELNVSWLKKNELDIKRHVGELRDSIKQNWTSAGGEIGRDLKQFWQVAGISMSRPASPAPSLRRKLSLGDVSKALEASGAKSPTTLDYLKHLDVPRAPSPGGSSRQGRSDDFAAGYSLGLLGSVRSWMSRTRRSLRDSQPGSPEGTDDEDLRSPTSEQGDPFSPTTTRGRRESIEDVGSDRIKIRKEDADAMDVVH